MGDIWAITVMIEQIFSDILLIAPDGPVRKITTPICSLMYVYDDDGNLDPDQFDDDGNLDPDQFYEHLYYWSRQRKLRPYTPDILKAMCSGIAYPAQHLMLEGY